jgi:DNA-binding transcriptional MocR family regulator
MVAPLMPEILTRWLMPGQAQHLVARQRVEIAARRELACQCLQGLAFRTAPDMPYLFLPLAGHGTVTAFTARLRLAGVLVRTMDHFAAGRTPPPEAVRVSLNATASINDLRQGLAAIARAWHSAAGATHQTM